MKRISLIFFICLQSFLTWSQNSDTIDSLYRGSYKVYELQRLTNGMYRDSKLFSGNDYHPISISNTGIGLISLCIADAMEWITNGEDLALITLKSVTGHTPDFNPDRTQNGYFRHWLDPSTGQQAWNSEYSTIDTDILMCGALFCMKYFHNDSISFYVYELWNSIDFEAAIMDETTGQIYLTINEDGTGVPGSLTSPYNEYMIVAWLAKNSTDDPGSISHILWNSFYNSPESLPKATYNDINILSDGYSWFVSSFVHQFNYYLCNHFTTSPAYLEYFKYAQMGDSAWWNTVGNYEFEWGLGAGSAISDSYHADAINNNPDTIFSPHIIAGYLPVNLNGKNDLIKIWNMGHGKYTLPTGAYNQILGRYSLTDTNWIPNEVQGIDYSTMLFGLSTLPEYLGSDFFSSYNDFFPMPLAFNKLNKEIMVNAYPNPFTNSVKLEFDKVYKNILIRVYDTDGRLVVSKELVNSKTTILELTGYTGIFILNITYDLQTTTTKLCKL